jgi:hypothetical protein
MGVPAGHRHGPDIVILENRGIVDQAGQRSELPPGLPDQAARGVRLLQVGGENGGVPAGGGDMFAGLLRALARAV